MRPRVSKLLAWCPTLGAILLILGACGGSDEGFSPQEHTASQGSPPAVSPPQSSEPGPNASQSAGRPGQLFYQRDDFVIRSAAVPDGDERVILPLKQAGTLSLAADAENLYWMKSVGSGAMLGTSTLDGENPHMIARVGLGIHELAVSDGYVYWADGRGYDRVKGLIGDLGG